MISDRVQSGETDRTWVFARDALGAGVAGATIVAAIRRDLTNTWWNGSGFQAAYLTNALIEADATNLPGLYYYDFSVPADQSGNVIIYITTTTGTIVNAPWVCQVKVGGYVNYLTADLSTIAAGVDVLNPSTTILNLLRSRIIVLGQTIDKIDSDVNRLVRVSGLKGN